MSKAISAKSHTKSATKVQSKAAAKPQPKKSRSAPSKPSAKAPSAPSRPPKTSFKKPAVATKAKTVKPVASAAEAPKKDLSKKPVKTAPVPVQKLSIKALPKPLPKPESKPAQTAKQKTTRFSKNDLEVFKIELLAMRDRITGQSGAMRSAALQRSDEINPEEDGTDAFMRLQTLEQVSSQQQLVANIDESLRAIEKGSYGVCDTCGDLINKPRLSVLPFAKNCITCQSELERPPRTVGRR